MIKENENTCMIFYSLHFIFLLLFTVFILSLNILRVPLRLPIKLSIQPQSEVKLKISFHFVKEGGRISRTTSVKSIIFTPA